mmetsp:Transcript_4954/g.18636  ORF Transcript_4954/g.18636 Transcript_4954/m.18636 type:complete len:178 (-) Transcript_4954:5564-6097(-)
MRKEECCVKLLFCVDWNFLPFSAVFVHTHHHAHHIQIRIFATLRYSNLPSDSPTNNPQHSIQTLRNISLKVILNCFPTSEHTLLPKKIPLSTDSKNLKKKQSTKKESKYSIPSNQKPIKSSIREKRCVCETTITQKRNKVPPIPATSTHTVSINDIRKHSQSHHQHLITHQMELITP